MGEPLQILWKEMVDIGYKVRSNHLDGLKSWQPYKTKYSNYVLEGYEDGIPLNNNFVMLSESLNYTFNDKKDQSDVIFTIGNDNFDNKIETNHFLIQHFRIPRLENYKLSVLKVLQLAYNIGQLKAVFENESVYNNKLYKFYYENRLDDISTYISADIYNRNINKLEQKGAGSYYHKYIKYKNKYIQLKKTGVSN